MQRILKLLFFIVVPVLGLSLHSCEDLLNLGDNNDELTTGEVADGLKTALKVGTDSAVSVVSVTDGYYLNQVIRIPLPDEASIITDNLDNPVIQNLGLSKVLESGTEQVVLSINRSAEEAAKQAAPVFKEAITGMSITDAWSILNGKNPAASRKSAGESFDSTAATAYLRSTTYNSLVNLYTPIVNQVLDRDAGPGFSANMAWNTLSGTYNQAANSFLGQAAGLDPVETRLDEFVIAKALDGLFHMVGQEEIKIRRNPMAWASTAVGNIFKKVFGN